MANVKKNERYIPLKNYIIALAVVVSIILLTWYGFAWYNVLKENRVSTSYLVSSKAISYEINGLEEVTNVFQEVPDSYYIYISYTGSEEIYNMEKNLASLIKDYNLSENFYYFNITSFKNEKDYIDKINEALNLTDKKVSTIPTIIYYKDGEVSNIITKEGNVLMNVSDFQKMLDVSGAKKE